MDKVIVEITKEGYKVTVNVNGEEYSQEYRATEFGSEQVSGVDFETTDQISDELYDALNSFFAYDVMKALSE
ncbi:hypothetical protein E8L90_06340 [Brevibacillus antibioticus]|uniref:Uncharacterized protein n=1 Tax=Brevibacillus antibioticus TaxID=2570228 RepID=A0A4U2Y3W3_9BACL|nr:hypothetical protein [Brevibacillus antibioticus]TKI55107.1 hypothetical protein E8L90_06340 [Brevibacillus antibioticus]